MPVSRSILFSSTLVAATITRNCVRYPFGGVTVFVYTVPPDMPEKLLVHEGHQTTSRVAEVCTHHAELWAGLLTTNVSAVEITSPERARGRDTRDFDSWSEGEASVTRIERPLHPVDSVFQPAARFGQ